MYCFAPALRLYAFAFCSCVEVGAITSVVDAVPSGAGVGGPLSQCRFVPNRPLNHEGHGVVHVGGDELDFGVLSGPDAKDLILSLIHISEPTRLDARSRMPSSA